MSGVLYQTRREGEPIERDCPICEAVAGEFCVEERSGMHIDRIFYRNSEDMEENNKEKT